MRRCRWAGVVLLAAAAAACSDPVGSGSERSLLSLRSDVSPPFADTRLVVFDVSDGGWHATVHGGDMDFQRNSMWWTTDPLPIASPGTLKVEVALTRGSDTVAMARVPFGVDRRWQYELDVYIGRGDPRKFAWVICIPDVYAFPIRTPGMGADSMYLVWGGLPRGAVC